MTESINERAQETATPTREQASRCEVCGHAVAQVAVGAVLTEGAWRPEPRGDQMTVSPARLEILGDWELEDKQFRRAQASIVEMLEGAGTEGIAASKLITCVSIKEGLDVELVQTALSALAESKRFDSPKLRPSNIALVS